MLHNLKMLIRSRSWDFMTSRKAGLENYSRKLYQYNWNNNPVYYRPGTSDRGLVYNILIQKGKKAEYYVEPGVEPKVILDIGANIGITAVWLASKFPNAKIYCFEPMQDNFEILQKNISPYPNIQALNYGLGKETGEINIYPNIDLNNRGGFSLYTLDSDPINLGTTGDAYATIQIRNATDAFGELGIESVDLIKIDTEGAEFDIIMSIPDRTIADCQWIMGELHGIKNFEILAYLDQWHSIGMKKHLKSNLFQFFAINKKLV